MSTISEGATPAISGRTSRWTSIASVVALLVVTPVISHVHLGVIRMSFWFAIVPAFTAWGLGALFVRELARRRQQGWPAIIVLGLAIALAEECLFVQTSFFPLLGVDPQHAYGRIAGVNWTYLLWALGYETVWAFVIPIFLVESLFPAARDKPWLGRVGLSVLAALFLGFGVMRWYAWTQIFIPQNFPAWNQGPSHVELACAFLAVIALGLATIYGLPHHPVNGSSDVRVPSQFALMLVGCSLGLVWSALLFLSYGVAPYVPVVLAWASGVSVCALSCYAISRWTGSKKWRHQDGFPLIFGALLASALSGFLILRGGQAPPLDYAGKTVVNSFVLISVGWPWRAASKHPSFSTSGVLGDLVATVSET